MAGKDKSKKFLPTIKVTMRCLGDLTPYVRNARTHSPAQVDMIAESIKEFGFNNPVLIGADGVIIAGHGRVMAAQKLQMAEVPTVELAHLTDTQKRAYILADNKLAEEAGWDVSMLAIELGDLSAEGFDIGIAGFDASDLDAIGGELADDGPQLGAVEYRVMIECEDEGQQSELIGQLEKQGYICRPLML